jgi:hypothetical protein
LLLFFGLAKSIVLFGSCPNFLLDFKFIEDRSPTAGFFNTLDEEIMVCEFYSLVTADVAILFQGSRTVCELMPLLTASTSDSSLQLCDN